MTENNLILYSSIVSLFFILVWLNLVLSGSVIYVLKTLLISSIFSLLNSPFSFIFSTLNKFKCLRMASCLWHSKNIVKYKEKSYFKSLSKIYF